MVKKKAQRKKKGKPRPKPLTSQRQDLAAKIVPEGRYFITAPYLRLAIAQGDELRKAFDDLEDCVDEVLEKCEELGQTEKDKIEQCFKVAKDVAGSIAYGAPGE